MVSEFSLIHSAQGPVLLLSNIFQGCTALLDTGALFPVWTKGDRLLKGIGGRFDFGDISFTGFGGECKASVYKLNFCLGNIIFPDMSILCINDDAIPGYFLLSATMFYGCKYTIDNLNKKLWIDTYDNQVCRLLKIRNDKGKLYILYNDISADEMGDKI